MRPTSIDDLELRRRWNLADDDPGPISFPNMQIPRGEAGPNGKAYSDGRFAPNGGYRGIDPKTGQQRRHYGLDLPAASGTDVVAARDGVVMTPIPDPQNLNYGKSVVVAYDGGKLQGLYGHLGPAPNPRVGSRVKIGQKIGEVGTSGNAKNKGNHVHYEVRQARVDKKTKADITWKKPSLGGGVPVYPDFAFHAGTRRMADRLPKGGMKICFGISNRQNRLRARTKYVRISKRFRDDITNGLGG